MMFVGTDNWEELVLNTRGLGDVELCPVTVAVSVMAAVPACRRSGENRRHKNTRVNSLVIFISLRSF